MSSAEFSRERVESMLAEGTPETKAFRNASLAGLDLSHLDLSKQDFAGADLTATNLSETNLSGANLAGAQLTGAVLYGADLRRAEFIGAVAKNANFTCCDASRAGFGGTCLEGSSFFESTLVGTTFTQSSLKDADLRCADLQGARLHSCNLEDVDASSADLRNAELDGSRVGGASFDGADLRGGRMKGVQDFEQASFLGTDIRDTDFRGAYAIRRRIVDENYLHEFRSKNRRSEWLYRLWWATSDCGRSFWRWGVWTGVMVGLFAVAYSFVDIDFGAYETPLSPLYFSVVTLTTLGYGDVLPMTVSAQIIAMIEVIVGYVALGGLLSILANKMGHRGE